MHLVKRKSSNSEAQFVNVEIIQIRPLKSLESSELVPNSVRPEGRAVWLINSLREA